MAGENIWGQLGDIIFQFMTTPVYGSYTSSKSANFSLHNRIITRQGNLLYGQKPLKQIAGLELERISFSLKISAIILKTIETTTLGRVGTTIGLGGSLAGSQFGTINDDKRFYEKIPELLYKLNTIYDFQEAVSLVIGEDYKGEYNIISLSERIKHYPDGKIKIAEIDIELEEYIEPGE